MQSLLQGGYQILCFSKDFIIYSGLWSRQWSVVWTLVPSVVCSLDSGPVSGLYILDSGPVSGGLHFPLCRPSVLTPDI